jgi:trigger factor
MQVSVESGEGLERRMRVELPADQIDAEVEKRVKKAARNVRMDGFRPGKVPLSLIRQRYGAAIREEVFGDLVQSSYFEAVAKENLKPAGQPKIEPLEDGAANGYLAVFEVMPEFELGDFGGIQISRPQAEVTDADVDAMVDKLRQQRVTWNAVERPAADGDQVTVDFQGRLEGEEEPFEGGSAEGVDLVLGSGRMIDGFEQALLGAAAGETRNLELKFPEDYRVENLAGKPVTFEVQVRSVAESELPEIDDEFARTLGVAEGGVESMRADIRANMERELRQKVSSVVKQQVMDGVLAVNAIDVPKALVDDEVKHLQEQARSNMASSGHGSNVELPASLFEEQARRRVALGLIIGRVVSEHQIEVDPDRVRSMVEEQAATYEDPQEVIDWYYSNKQQLSAVESVALEDQVVDWVVERAQVEDDSTSFEQLMQGAD